MGSRIDRPIHEMLQPYLPKGPTGIMQLMDPDGKKAKLVAAADVLQRGLKDIYGENDPPWYDSTLKDAADDGVFYSATLGKYITVPPDVQEAAKYIVENGGATIFDREGDVKDGRFIRSDVNHYINQSQRIYKGNEV